MLIGSMTCCRLLVLTTGTFAFGLINAVAGIFGMN